MKLAQTFARILKRSRKEAQLSQMELAEKSGLDRTFISLLERGERQPSLTTLFVLAQALGTSPSSLIQMVEKQMRRSRWTRHVM